MADLTEEQKIIIGVCVGVAGLILIAILIFACCIFYAREKKRRRRNGYKDNLIIERHHDRYPVYEKQLPPVIYDPPPPPPPPQVWREPAYYRKPRSMDVPYRRDSWDRYSDRPRRTNRWDGGYRNEPIVVPMSEPEYVSSGAPRREPDTIYLKYVQDKRPGAGYLVTPPYQVSNFNRYVIDRSPGYVDDQALLPRTNYARRSDYEGAYGSGLRRSRSFNDMRGTRGDDMRYTRGGNAFVGEWGRRPEYPSEFNERAYRDGRDPYLWKN